MSLAPVISSHQAEMYSTEHCVKLDNLACSNHILIKTEYRGHTAQHGNRPILCFCCDEALK